MRVLDPPHGGIYTQRSEVVRTCSRCEAEIQPGQEYGKSKGDWYLVLCENCLRPLYEDCQRYQARLRSSTTRVILGTDASPHGWAFIVIQDDGKGARREIHRAHGQNANDLPITPMEGMAVVQALRWFKAALSRREVPDDAMVQVGSDNLAVDTKLNQPGRTQGIYSDVWRDLADLLKELGDRVVGGFDTFACQEAHDYCQKHAFEKEQ